MSEQLAPWIETSIRAAVSEIQRRNRARNFVLIADNGERAPVITTEEMLKILREFLESGQEGFDSPKVAPSGNKTLPRCEVPDCVNQASFIINERPLCYAHEHRNPLPPSLREKE